MDARAAILHEPDGAFSLHPVVLDEPGPGEVLVRLVATGVCQTDAHARHRQLPFPLPAILGHEGSGVVEQVGSGVASLRPGDHVVLTFASCGACPSCLAAHPAYCDRAFEANGAATRLDGSPGVRSTRPNQPVHGHFFGQSSFASHSLVNARNAVRVPPDVPLEVLGPLGCGLQTGAGTVLNVLRVRPGQSLAVLGTGAVGMAAILAAKLAGARTIVAVDIRPDRLALAAELGATHQVESSEEVAAHLRSIEPSGFDAVVELTALPAMLALGLVAVAPLGTVALVGGAPFGTEASIDMNTLLAGRTLRGVVQGESNPQVFIPWLVELHRAGRFPFEPLLSFYELDDINQAFADLQAGKAIKPVLRMSEP